MRIVDIRETAIPLRSNLRNAVFDFSEMTTSVVAVITDVVREGRPVTLVAEDGQKAPPPAAGKDMGGDKGEKGGKGGGKKPC